MNETGVLFDLDGVLIDSESLYTLFWEQIERDFPTGIPDYAHAIKGNTLTRILANYPDEATREAIKRRIHEYEDTMVYPVFEGVSEFLDALAEAGIPAAIVTSSDDVKMGYLYGQIPGFRERFAAVINGSMVTRSKPDPQGYLMGAEAIGRRVEDCFVFEDSLQGIEAGMRSGATTIAVATTISRAQLEGRAHAIIDGFSGLTVGRMLAVRERRLSRL